MNGVIKLLAAALLLSAVAACDDTPDKAAQPAKQPDANPGQVTATATKSKTPQPSAPLTDAQKAEVRKLVRETLKKNPEIVLEALRELRQREEAAKKEAQEKALAESRAQLLSDPDDPVGGNPKGSITIVEFFDYNCPYCKRAKGEIDKVVEGDPNIRVVFKEFPILGEGSVFAARAALAALRQGKYQKLHDAMISFRGRLDKAGVLRIAKAVGLDMDKLEADMKSPDIEKAIKRNMELAQKLGITGTPGFVIGDRLIPGAIPANQIQRYVAQARKSCEEKKAKVC